MAYCIGSVTLTGTRTDVTVNGTVVTSSRTATSGDDCVYVSDNTHPGLDHAFSLTKARSSLAWLVSNGVMYGSYGTSTTYSTYPSNSPPPVYFVNFGTSSADAARVLAASNPTRAGVKLPVFIFELKELPMMLHQAGFFLFKRFDWAKAAKGRFWDRLSPTQRLASANLALQFGWRPMISDLRNMILFTDACKKRENEWNRLYSGRGLRRRVKLGKVDGAPLTRAPDCPYPNGNTTASLTWWAEKWGTVRWKPSAPSPSFPRPTPDVIRRMFFGITAENIAENLWEALPWSWLVDWFSNAGDLITANQGKGYCLPSAPCIMTKHQSNWSVVGKSYRGADGSYLISSGLNPHAVQKTRSVVYATLTAQLPQLSAGQLSILGSLAVTRSRWAR